MCWQDLLRARALCPLEVSEKAKLRVVGVGRGGGWGVVGVRVFFGRGNETERARNSYAPFQRRCAGYFARSRAFTLRFLPDCFLPPALALYTPYGPPPFLTRVRRTCLRVILSPLPALPSACVYCLAVRPHPRRSSGSRPGGPASGWMPGPRRGLPRTIRAVATASVATLAAPTEAKQQKKAQKRKRKKRTGRKVLLRNDIRKLLQMESSRCRRARGSTRREE